MVKFGLEERLSYILHIERLKENMNKHDVSTFETSNGVCIHKITDMYVIYIFACFAVLSYIGKLSCEPLKV